ncbi:penicillin-insensitive murein endopeptidase [Nannocystis bainbridge]|uniref:Penicillin-insensitive murein endopeptidase n=1 Tax=Nannocystis bainbridge TaxID=2995303 RepID=A0ABT5DRC9_9BACT|nr:penicillin-insensitive murein endopeptidase [Nannocystis bainbridge]MDC0716149.1 penicillin-insensitive murein endopeptidase [Nannocystis bainbridge]
MSGALTALLALIVVGGANPDAPVTATVAGDPACVRLLEQTRFLEEPEWIDHVVRPRETLWQIGVRYGVTREALVEWNELEGVRARVRSGNRLKVLTDRVPPPRERIMYTAEPGDDWGEVAIRHRVNLDDLRAWNWKKTDTLEPGMTLAIWIDPGAPRTVHCRRGEPPPPLEFRKDAVSRGYPSGGRLIRGILVPLSPLWKRGKKDEMWASSHTLATMIEAFTRLRVDSGYDGEVFVGTVSRRKGGKFRPHKSHRTGLDIDVRLPLLPTIPLETYPTAEAVDWPALWELIKAFLDTGQVSVIFLDERLQEHLYWAARWDGKTPDELAPIIHWPRKGKKWESIIQHARGHKGHIHVRLLCGPNEALCRPGRAETLERRGWVEPRPSSKDSRDGARARREAWLLSMRGVDSETGEDEP